MKKVEEYDYMCGIAGVMLLNVNYELLLPTHNARQLTV